MSMSHQEIFDRVTWHMLQQGRQSISMTSQGPLCAYRGDNGSKCAVGCLIPDHLYTPALEGNRASEPRVWRALENAGVLEGGDWDTMNLLLRLQNIHDNYPHRGAWEHHLRYLAGARGLTFSPRPHSHPPLFGQFDAPFNDQLDEPFSKQTFQVHTDPVTGWKTPIMPPPLMWFDEEPDPALLAARAAIDKARTAERKDLTPVPELVAS